MVIVIFVLAVLCFFNCTIGLGIKLGSNLFGSLCSQLPNYVFIINAYYHIYNLPMSNIIALHLSHAPRVCVCTHARDTHSYICDDLHGHKTSSGLCRMATTSRSSYTKVH